MEVWDALSKISGMMCCTTSGAKIVATVLRYKHFLTCVSVVTSIFAIADFLKLDVLNGEH